MKAVRSLLDQYLTERHYVQAECKITAGKCIGGGSETAALKKSGELKRLLKELGLI